MAENLLRQLEAYGNDFEAHVGPIALDTVTSGRSPDLVDHLTVDYLQQRREDDSDTPGEWRGRLGVAIAVAATILVVVGVVVVAEGNSGDVATDQASVPSVTVPAAAAEDVVAEPEDEDTPGCEVSPAWVRVCDAATFDGGVMHAVTAGGPGVVAVGSQDLAYYTRATDPGQPWYAAGEAADAVVWTSPDGLIWTRIPHDEAVFGGDGSQQMFAVTAGGPGLVAVGRDGPAVDGEGHAAVWTSPDGFIWTRVPHDESVFGGRGEQRMVSVIAGGPGLVAVGFDGPAGNEEGDAAVWTSPDGFTWTRVAHEEAVFGGESGQMMLSVAIGGPGLVAVGSNGRPYDEDDAPIDELATDAAVWTSPDGLTWTRVPHDEAIFGGIGAQQMVSVTAGGPGLVAVGTVSDDRLPAGENSDAAVWTSPDGLTWTRVPHDETVFAVSGDLGDSEEQMLSVTAGGPGLVAVGFDGRDECGWDSAVWTSPDGLTWSRVPDDRNCGPDGRPDRILSVTVAGSGLVAVGEQHNPGVAAAVWNG